MSTRLAATSVAVAGLVLGAAWLLELPLERAVLLAPVLVVAAGAAAGLAVFWTRVGLDQIRESGHPRAIVGVVLGLLALVAVLTALGVDLPRE